MTKKILTSLGIKILAEKKARQRLKSTYSLTVNFRNKLFKERRKTLILRERVRRCPFCIRRLNMSSSSVSSDSFDINSHYTEEQANPEIDPEINPEIDPEIDPENYPDNFNVVLTQKQAVPEIDQPVPEIDQRNDPDNYNFNEVTT